MLWSDNATIPWLCIYFAVSKLLGHHGRSFRFCLEDGITPLEAAFWRMFFASCLFLSHATYKRQCRLHTWQDGVILFLFGAVSIGVFFVSLVSVVKMAGAAFAAVMLYTAPAWVALFSRLIFKEYITWTKALAIIFSLLGVVCISHAESSGGGVSISLSAVLVGIASGLLYATHFIFSKYFMSKYPAIVIYGYATLAGSFVVFPLVSFAHKSPENWLVLLALGFVCTYLAYLLYCAGLRRLEPTRAAVLATLEPVIAIIAAWVVWGEVFSPLGWFGTVLILLAVFVLVNDTNLMAVLARLRLHVKLG